MQDSSRTISDTFPQQVEVGHGKKAIIVFVPVPLLGNFHKIQQR
jgi:small subunit ribosomal protein S7e